MGKTLIPFVILLFAFISVNAYATNPPSALDQKPIATKFVNTNKLNIRNKPTNGSIVGNLRRGETVSIYARNGGWERISQENNQPQWVSSSLLCDSVGCHQKVYKQPLSKPRVAENRTQTNSSYGDTYCPCSGSKDCVGRRGGTFCYTSGGNKRYR